MKRIKHKFTAPTGSLKPGDIVIYNGTYHEFIEYLPHDNEYDCRISCWGEPFALFRPHSLTLAESIPPGVVVDRIPNPSAPSVADAVLNCLRELCAEREADATHEWMKCAAHGGICTQGIAMRSGIPLRLVRSELQRARAKGDVSSHQFTDKGPLTWWIAPQPVKSK